MEYLCTVTGSGFFGLTWRIRNATNEVGSTVYASTSISADATPANGFSVQQLMMNPIVSNISFTV